MEESRRRRWLVPGLLLLGVTAVVALALVRSRAGHDAHCDVAELEARAPELDEVALDDPSLLALGGEALADVLELCTDMHPRMRQQLSNWGEPWSPRITGLPAWDLSNAPKDLIALSRRTCAGDFDRMRDPADLPARERGYATFEDCRLETLGILDADDLDHVSPPPLTLWRVHRMLIESGVPEDLARRYFTAILVAAEIDERAPGQVVVRDGRLEIQTRHDGLVSAELDANGYSPTGAIETAQYEAFKLDAGCVHGGVSIAAAEPIAHLRWLTRGSFDGEACDHDAVHLAILEREQLLRPVRAELGIPLAGPERPAQLELDVDRSGAWRSRDGSEQGSDAAALAELIARIQPSSLRLHTDPQTPAGRVVDLLRVADSWGSTRSRFVALWLAIDAPTNSAEPEHR